ncbi:MAG: tetratricopeptide repeat protein [Herminiimonas sp.]|nr:tetratricopeptide repeat protein [Herminiimonas sp.]
MFSLQRSRQGSLPGIFVLLLIFCSLGLGGCATQTYALLGKPDAGLPRHAEISSTPFFAQERYQCGPATLAMALGAAGFKVEPDSLVSQVYVPQREGSFAPEMLAATRRNGALAMTIPPRMTALLTEVAAGNPVVVLENLSLPILPVWHYAVVIGYDLDRQEVVLRSGTIERLEMSLSTFEHTWSRGDYWGMVALPPGRLPATAEEGNTAEALVAFEQAGGAARVRPTWDAALKRWPHNLTMQIGSGNAAYAAGDKAAAAQAFRTASEDHPDSAPAFNNLASVLADMGQLDLARDAADKAIALGGPWRETALATKAEIEARKSKAVR